MSHGKEPIAPNTPYQPFEIRLPDKEGLGQDQEWCEIKMDGEWQRFRFHDYDALYKIPGLYECLFYRTLKCCSPQRVTSLLDDVLSDQDFEPTELRVLDVGAGNGMMGQELKALGASFIAGIDIEPEAKPATERDRPGVYDRYLITDLTDLPEDQEKQLRRDRINCVSTVAALGFGDIPPLAFLTALRVMEETGWLTFNIKEDFLSDGEGTGFSRLVSQLCRDEVIRFESYRRYQHRLAITGEPLYYVAVVASKLKDVPDSYFESDDFA